MVISLYRSFESSFLWPALSKVSGHFLTNMVILLCQLHLHQSLFVNWEILNDHVYVSLNLVVKLLIELIRWYQRSSRKRICYDQVFSYWITESVVYGVFVFWIWDPPKGQKTVHMPKKRLALLFLLAHIVLLYSITIEKYTKQVSQPHLPALVVV